MKLMINLVRVPVGGKNSVVRSEINVEYEPGEPQMDPGDRDYMAFETLMMEAIRNLQPSDASRFSKGAALKFLHAYVDQTWETLQKPAPHIAQS